jgi:hypothetical protein
MLDFSGKDQKAKQVCLHYANLLETHDLIGIIQNTASVTSKEQAIELSRLFWKMLEAAAADRDNGAEVLGEVDLQYWMERSMNIISGYLDRIGYGDEWEQVSDEV